MRRGLRPGFPESGGDADRWAEMERRISALERANRLTSASIGSGGLTVKDGGAIQVGGDVVLDPSGLHVAGGDVVAVHLDSLFQTYDSVPASLSDSITTYLTRNFTPPAWATRVQVVSILEGRAIVSVEADNFRLQIDIEGSLANSTATDLETSSAGRAVTCTAFRTLDTWSDPITVLGRARRSLSSGTATLTQLQLSTLFISTVG